MAKRTPDPNHLSVSKVPDWILDFLTTEAEVFGISLNAMTKVTLGTAIRDRSTNQCACTPCAHRPHTGFPPTGGNAGHQTSVHAHRVHTAHTPQAHHSPPLTLPPPTEGGSGEPPTPSPGGAHPGGFAAGRERKEEEETAQPELTLAEKVHAMSGWREAGKPLLPETSRLIDKFLSGETAGKRRPVRAGEARLLGRAFRQHSKPEDPWLSKANSEHVRAPVVAPDPAPRPPGHENDPEAPEALSRFARTAKSEAAWQAARARFEKQQTRPTKRNEPAEPDPEEGDVKRNALALEQLRREQEGGDK